VEKITFSEHRELINQMTPNLRSNSPTSVTEHPTMAEVAVFTPRRFYATSRQVYDIRRTYEHVTDMFENDQILPQLRDETQLKLWQMMVSNFIDDDTMWRDLYFVRRTYSTPFWFERWGVAVQFPEDPTLRDAMEDHIIRDLNAQGVNGEVQATIIALHHHGVPYYLSENEVFDMWVQDSDDDGEFDPYDYFEDFFDT
jgi:hypothetical protein